MKEKSEFKSPLSYSDRKMWIPETIKHPAKAHLGMVEAIILEYTKEGDTILDPMAGIGSTLIIGVLHNRNVIGVEYEERFCKTIRANIELNRKQSRLQPLGHAEIIQGDARFLPVFFNAVGDIDGVVFSPPYASQWGVSDENKPKATFEREKRHKERHPDKFRPPLVAYSDSPDNIGNLKYGDIDSVVFSPAYGNIEVGKGIREKRWEKVKDREGFKGRKEWKSGTPSHYSDKAGNVGNLKYGDIDAIVTSPPYAESAHDPSLSEETIRKTEESQGRKYTRKSFTGAHDYSKDKANIGNLKFDSIITSPPYEEAMGDKHHAPSTDRIREEKKIYNTYTERGKDNIGNLKGQTYLEAMKMVYQGCYDVLKGNGIMVLITKNFIRNKQIIPLDQHTIKLCESVGFTFVKRHYRKILHPSFWRILYKKKHGIGIDFEDILVFKKESVLNG